MSEQEASHEELEAFREEFQNELDSAVFIVGTGLETSFALSAKSFGLREEPEDDLPQGFKAVMQAQVYKTLEINEEEKPEPVNEYPLPPEGSEDNYLVRVYKRSYEDPETGDSNPIYLHETTGPSGGLSWLISTSSDTPSELLAPED